MELERHSRSKPVFGKWRESQAYRCPGIAKVPAGGGRPDRSTQEGPDGCQAVHCPPIARPLALSLAQCLPDDGRRHAQDQGTDDRPAFGCASANPKGINHPDGDERIGRAKSQSGRRRGVDREPTLKTLPASKVEPEELARVELTCDAVDGGLRRDRSRGNEEERDEAGESEEHDKLLSASQSRSGRRPGAQLRERKHPGAA